MEMIGRVLSGRISRVKGRRETLKERVLHLLGGWPKGLVTVKFVLKSQTSPYKFRHTFNCSVTYPGYAGRTLRKGVFC